MFIGGRSLSGSGPRLHICHIFYCVHLKRCIYQFNIFKKKSLKMEMTDLFGISTNASPRAKEEGSRARAELILLVRRKLKWNPVVLMQRCRADSGESAFVNSSFLLVKPIVSYCINTLCVETPAPPNKSQWREEERMERQLCVSTVLPFFHGAVCSHQSLSRLMEAKKLRFVREWNVFGLCSLWKMAFDAAEKFAKT